MVTIRLARHGGKKQPFYHLTVAEKARARDGRFIERVGFYNPVARGREETLRVDIERVDYWIGAGAQPSERVRQLIARWRKSAAAAEPAAADETAASAAEPAAADETAASAAEPA